MAITLASLPIEVLHLICRCLCNHSDVSRFRLVCRVFADVGLRALAATVTFALTPESLARLRFISSHPVLRHHVSTVVCLMNVFYPYSTLEHWKLEGQDEEDWDRGSSTSDSVPQIPDPEWAEDWTSYQSLLAGQEEAFEALEPSQDVENACRRLTNLGHLEIRLSTAQAHLHNCQTYQSLVKRYPNVQHSSDPFYPFGAENSYIGLPGVKPLRTLLCATASSEVRSLRITALDAEFFDGDGEAEVDSLMRQSIRHLRILKLSFCIHHDDEHASRPRARRILSTNRLRNFLCSAPDLEDIEVNFDWLVFGNEPFIGKAGNILPRECTWPRLERLRLANTEIVSAPFLDFLRSHRKTLRQLELSNCEIVAGLDQGPQHQQCRWSDVFIPLVTTNCLVSLSSLSLSGEFRSSRPTNQDLDLDLDQGPIVPYIDMHDTVQDMELTVGEALEMVICSEQFDSFLHQEVAGCEDLTVETVKKGIIQDLMDKPPERVVSRMVAIPTRYAGYFKSFSLLTDSSLWGKWWWENGMPPKKHLLEPLEVPWSN